MLVSDLFPLKCVLISQLTQKVLLGVLQLEVLIGELVAVDTLAASAVALGEVTALDHELLDNTVEAGALVAVALLAGSKGTEVLSSLLKKQWLAGDATVSQTREESSPWGQSCRKDQGQYVRGPRRHAGCRSRPCW